MVNSASIVYLKRRNISVDLVKKFNRDEQIAEQKAARNNNKAIICVETFSINSRTKINWYYTRLELFSLSTCSQPPSNEAVTLLID